MNSIIKNCAKKEKKPIRIKDTLYPRVLERAKKTKCKIDKHTLHRAKAVARKREIMKAQNDIDNHKEVMTWDLNRVKIPGYKPEMKTDWFKIWFYIITGGIALALVWAILITIIDIII